MQRAMLMPPPSGPSAEGHYGPQELRESAERDVGSFLIPFAALFGPGDVPSHRTMTSSRIKAALAAGMLAGPLLALGQITPGVQCLPNADTCLVPPNHKQALFGDYRAVNGVFSKDHLWMSPVGFIPPRTKGRMVAYGYGYYVYPPEPGVAVRRQVDASDKANGIVDFIHLADLNRPLRAGDTFGWRMRVVTHSTERFGVSDVIQTPLGARIYSRPAGPSSRWHEHRPEEENPCRTCSGGADDVFYNARLLKTPDRGTVKAYVSYDSTATAFESVFNTGNFWTVNKDDPSGTYVSEIWAYNKLIMRIHFPVEMKP
jgi:hypothetical protein